MTLEGYELEKDSLMHHGILGQKWGVRRYQNYDGTLIHPKGTRKNVTKKELTPEEKRNKAIKTVAGAALMAGAFYIGYNPALRTKAVDFIKKHAKETIKEAANIGDKTVAAVISASLLTYGMYNVSNLDMKLASDGASELQRSMAREAATAGVQEFSRQMGATVAAKGNTNQNNQNTNTNNQNSNTNMAVARAAADRLGPPNNRTIDKSSQAYQNLFRGITDPDTRSQIKSLAAAGYGLDQLELFVSGLRHSDLLPNKWGVRCYQNYGDFNDELYHYGIPGMKWGVRNWQYDNGRYTPEGLIRYFGSKKARRKAEQNKKEQAKIRKKAQTHYDKEKAHFTKVVNKTNNKKDTKKHDYAKKQLDALNKMDSKAVQKEYRDRLLRQEYRKKIGKRISMFSTPATIAGTTLGVAMNAPTITSMIRNLASKRVDLIEPAKVAMVANNIYKMGNRFGDAATVVGAAATTPYAMKEAKNYSSAFNNKNTKSIAIESVALTAARDIIDPWFRFATVDIIEKKIDDKYERDKRINSK